MLLLLFSLGLPSTKDGGPHRLLRGVQGLLQKLFDLDGVCFGLPIVEQDGQLGSRGEIFQDIQGPEREGGAKRGLSLGNGGSPPFLYPHKGHSREPGTPEPSFSNATAPNSPQTQTPSPHRTPGQLSQPHDPQVGEATIPITCQGIWGGGLPEAGSALPIVSRQDVGPSFGPYLLVSTVVSVKGTPLSSRTMKRRWQKGQCPMVSPSVLA